MALIEGAVMAEVVLSNPRVPARLDPARALRSVGPVYSTFPLRIHVLRYLTLCRRGADVSGRRLSRDDLVTPTCVTKNALALAFQVAVFDVVARLPRQRFSVGIETQRLAEMKNEIGFIYRLERKLCRINDQSLERAQARRVASLCTMNVARCASRSVNLG